MTSTAPAWGELEARFGAGIEKSLDRRELPLLRRIFFYELQG
jgi:hypothetical protein